MCVDGEEIQAEKLEGAGERGIEMSERLELNGTRGGRVAVEMRQLVGQWVVWAGRQTEGTTADEDRAPWLPVWR